jgi:Predicted ATPase related to phosphate starvation-inducible protein PhoH
MTSKPTLYVIDTNSLIDYPHLILKYDVVITSPVLRELEKLETTRRHDKELQKKITKAKTLLDNEGVNYHCDLSDYTSLWGVSEGFDSQYVDNQIIQCCIENGYGLITRDKLLRLKANAKNIPVIKPENESSEVYTGYKIAYIDDDNTYKIYEDRSNNAFNLITNQYLIIRDDDGKTKDILRWNGESHVGLNIPYEVIKPKNDLQACALDILYNDSIPVKFILGTYGSGKTFLTTKIAVHNVIEKGNRSTILAVRNPVGSGEQIGFLSGDFDDKTAGFFEPIIQHFDGGEQDAERFERNGQLKKAIPFYMKGVSIDNTFMIVDEAEDLDTKTIKLIGTRIGENTVCAFCGDYNQAEGKFVNNNGLSYAVEALKGNPLVGVILLDRDVRSDASRIFAEI